MKRVRSFLSCALLLVSAAVTAVAAEHRHGDTRPDRNAMWQAMLTKQQTLAVSVAFDGEGRLWRARVQDGHVLVDRSDNEGASFGAPVTVNPDKEVVAAEGDSAPKIALAADGAIYVSYTQLLNKPFSGDIRFSRSLDGGKRFSAPVTVNDNRDVIGHRFDALIVGRDGKVYVVWLDKRDKAVAKQRGEEYAGAALYYAVSTDRGASFTANRKLADHTCECCRIALDLAPDGRPVAFWRHVFEGGERDHALMKFDGQSTPRRVTHDRWRIDACPHHGPALSIDADGHHLAWFDNAPDARGLFYARSADGGASLSPPLAFGDLAAQPGHADVLSLGREVFLVWKEFNGEASVIRMQASSDAGASWTAPRTLAETGDSSDYPRLAARGAQVFLSWNTVREGHRLFPLKGAAR